VTLDAMRYHTECVARGVQKQNGRPIVLGDMPFGTYATPEQAFRSASVLMQAGAHMVKLEGGGWTTDTVHFLVERGIPVCAHLGLTPQTVHALGGYRVQGKTQASAESMKRQAHELQDAGASLMVLEMVPAQLAAELTTDVSLRTRLSAVGMVGACNSNDMPIQHGGCTSHEARAQPAPERTATDGS
jgi:3-methyl-2-oxobutanoate hydroxymethyltransferase